MFFLGLMKEITNADKEKIPCLHDKIEIIFLTDL